MVWFTIVIFTSKPQQKSMEALFADSVRCGSGVPTRYSVNLRALESLLEQTQESRVNLWEKKGVICFSLCHMHYHSTCIVSCPCLGKIDEYAYTQLIAEVINYLNCFSPCTLSTWNELRYHASCVCPATNVLLKYRSSTFVGQDGVREKEKP